MTQKKIIPVGQKLLIEPIKAAEELSEGGVILSSVNNAELAKGRILAVSKQLEHAYKEGEVVLYYEKRALNIYQDEKILQLIDGGDGIMQGDVLAILG
jgi:co-chaperonin GroES (HSP10)